MRLLLLFFSRIIDPFDYFLLDPENGELRTAKPLDREALENSTGVLTFGIRAMEVIDGQPSMDKSSMSVAEATITIKDVNDEPPTFNRKEYNIAIPENIVDGTPLPHLDMMVRDSDIVSICNFITASNIFCFLLTYVNFLVRKLKKKKKNITLCIIKFISFLIFIISKYKVLK